MSTQKFSNNASSLLAVSISAADVSVQVESGGGAEFPSVGASEHFMIAVENATGDIEYMRVTARSGDIMTVTRAQEGSSARAFTASQARVELRLTKESCDRFVQHESGTVTRDLVIPNLDVSATLDVTGAVLFSSTLGLTGAFTGTTGAFSTSLTVASVSVRDAALFNTGSLADARLSSNVPLKNATAAFTAAVSSSVSLTAPAVTGSSTVACDRLIAGYDSGVSGSVNASGWFRSNGSSGWFNATYSGGINQEDTTFVRVYGGKHFYVPAGGLYASGDITAYYSDERLKTRVGSLYGALDKVLSLEGFLYVENELAREHGYSNTLQQVGVSAQAVQRVLPEAVSLAPFDIHVDPDTNEIVSKSGKNFLTLNYAKLVPLLIEAIKELTARVKELEDAA